MMLRGLGSTEHVTSSDLCCDVCSHWKVPYVQLDVMSPGRRSCRQKPKAVRIVDASLEDTLFHRLANEWQKVMEENPAFSTLGCNFLCPDPVLFSICKRAPYISALQHMDVYFLRPELRERFYRVVCDAVAAAPLVHSKH